MYINIYKLLSFSFKYQENSIVVAGLLCINNYTHASLQLVCIPIDRYIKAWISPLSQLASQPTNEPPIKRRQACVGNQLTPVQANSFCGLQLFNLNVS